MDPIVRGMLRSTRLESLSAPLSRKKIIDDQKCLPRSRNTNPDRSIFR